VRPDIVFTRGRVAVFIDGCFWHGCPQHGRRLGVQNEHYWGPKIARNAERDQRNTETLVCAGWMVLRFWEHEPADHVAREITRIHSYVA
jgi:DNA mismatch endonuclease (patch repair protein)